MADANPFQCLMAGLPGTGKTTFLAALWHVAKSNEVPRSMQLERREGDQEYLNRIADQWSRCAELERTPGGDEIEVTILLRDPASGGVVRLRIPDMSGEIFASQWETRRCTTSFADLVNELGGCLLFVHPEKVTDTLWIADANAIYDGWAGAGADESEKEDKVSEGSGWDPRESPTQVQMIELLQFLAELSRRPLRLAVIVSAWDLVTEPLTPAAWVEKRLPLLWQYITANPERFSISFMGVSAQGGKTSDAALLDHATASHRIRIHASGSNEHDITHPIRWLMSPMV